MRRFWKPLLAAAIIFVVVLVLSHKLSRRVELALGLALASAALVVVLALLRRLIIRRRMRMDYAESLGSLGAEIVGQARYRGRRVLHYSDGSVVAETHTGFRQFENFDAYRSFADRR